MSFGGLDEKLRYYEYELDSAAADYSMTRDSSARDWPIFKLGGKKPLQNIAGIKILEAQIPFSWYVFNSLNTTFVLTESGSAPVQVTLPLGNFTVSQMITVLGTALTTASPNLLTYTVTFDSTLQKFSFWNNALTTIPYSFTFGDISDSGENNPRNMLGFSGGNTFSQSFLASGTPQGDYMVAPFVVSVTGPNYLYVNSFKLGNLTDLYVPITADTLTRGNSGPQMAKVSVNVQPGGTIDWRDPSPTMFFDLENLNNLSEIDFFLSLGNTSKTPLKLNGQSFSLKLGILVNEFTNSAVSSGTAANGRVMNRISKR